MGATELRRGTSIASVFFGVIAWAGPIQAQVERPVSLDRAISSALATGFDARIAASREDAARSGAREASSALLPNVSLESGFMRSSDPVAAFGTRLRQGRFSEADFAVSSLNDPDPLSDWTAGVRVAWGGLDPSRWATVSAARSDADAMAAAADRTREGVRFETTALYLGAVRADARVRAADAAVEAARSTRDRFQLRFEQGLLTEADVLLARAETAAAEAAAIAATQARADARRRLGVALGWTADSVPVPSDGLAPPNDPQASNEGAAGPSPAVEGSTVGPGPVPTGRADLLALRARLAAAEARVRAASAGWLPKIEAFGAYTAHASRPLTSDQPEWTVGVGLRWDLFTGFRRSAGIARANAEADALRAELSRGERVARAEVAEAREARVAAARAWEASRLASDAASAGRDLMRRRFEEGLADPTDLLRAEARATDMERAAIDALAGIHLAEARLRFVIGEGDPDGGTAAPTDAAPGGER